MSRRIVIVATLACLLSSALGCAVVRSRRRAMSDLTLAVSIGEKHVLGEPVSARVSITNNTSKLVLFPDIRDWKAPQPIYRTERPDGTTVVYDPQHDRPRYSDLQHLPRDLVTGIEPGAAIDDMLSLTSHVKLDQPGRYTITALLKWDQYDLVSEPAAFTVAAAAISDIVMHEVVRDFETPPVAEPEEPSTWTGIYPFGTSVRFQATEGGLRPRAAEASLEWDEPEPIVSRIDEWTLDFGDIDVSDDDMPAGVHLIPQQATGSAKAPVPDEAMAWADTGLWLGWPEVAKPGGPTRFPWHHIATPKPIERALRFVSGYEQKWLVIDAFVIFEGENAELGHSHIKTTSVDVDKGTQREEHTPLRPIAQLGPDLVAAQVMLGQPEMGSPIIIAAVRSIPTGTSVSFLRVDSNGTIVGKAQRAIAGFRPLGPVAMRMRVRGGLVEAAFPAEEKPQGALHVLRVATTADLRAIEAPIISAAIPIEGPTPSMTIEYSRFPPFFPNGVGLLMRQPGDKAFFWSEARGFKRLPFVLRDRDEALLTGRRSSWYVLVNTGTSLSGVAIESYFREHRPKGGDEYVPGGIE
jgi:hypothetical protein